ncbi:MAG: hypothetical protein ABEI52_06445 [Halobacteriaceae archaeon]
MTIDSMTADQSPLDDSRRVIDVSDLTASGFRAYADTAIADEELHVERRAGKTFLVKD